MYTSELKPLSCLTSTCKQTNNTIRYKYVNWQQEHKPCYTETQKWSQSPCQLPHKCGRHNQDHPSREKNDHSPQHLHFAD